MIYFRMQLLHLTGSPVSTPRNLPTSYTSDVTHIYLTLQLSYSPKLRYLGSDEGMTCLDKLRQAYMLAALNTKEAHSKQNRDNYDDMPQYKIGDLIMIKNFNKKSNWDAKYIPNFRIIRLIGTRQLEVSDLTSGLRKVNICDVLRILPSEFIVSCIPDEQVFSRKGKYINDPCIFKEVMVIDAFPQENFTDIKFKCY